MNSELKDKSIILFLMILLLASLLFLRLETQKRDDIINKQNKEIVNLKLSFTEFESDKELIKDLRLGKYEQ